MDFRLKRVNHSCQTQVIQLVWSVSQCVSVSETHVSQSSHTLQTTLVSQDIRSISPPATLHHEAIHCQIWAVSHARSRCSLLFIVRHFISISERARDRWWCSLPRPGNPSKTISALVALASFQFPDLFTIGRTPWTSDQPVARPLPKHRRAQTQNKHMYTPSIHARSGIRTHDHSVRAKTVHALDLSANVTSDRISIACLNSTGNTVMFNWVCLRLYSTS
jgi:hypothetical protein